MALFGRKVQHVCTTPSLAKCCCTMIHYKFTSTSSRSTSVEFAAQCLPKNVLINLNFHMWEELASKVYSLFTFKIATTANLCRKTPTTSSLENKAQKQLEDNSTLLWSPLFSKCNTYSGVQETCWVEQEVKMDVLPGDTL